MFFLRKTNEVRNAQDLIPRTNENDLDTFIVLSRSLLNLPWNNIQKKNYNDLQRELIYYYYKVTFGAEVDFALNYAGNKHSLYGICLYRKFAIK